MTASIKKFGRRTLLKGLAAGGAALGAPTLWIPSTAHAQTSGRGSVRHLIYIRLAGGFRFTTAFNGDVDGQFNPFGVSRIRAAGTEWGATTLLESATWLTDRDGGETRKKLGMQKVTAITSSMCLFPCVDHEPTSARADGNHGSGLERFLTGYVGGSTSFLSLLNYGLKEVVAQAGASGRTLLPAFSLGDAGMAIGSGIYAGYRPPVLDGDGFDRFDAGGDGAMPAWATGIAAKMDERYRARLHTALRPQVESYQQTRDATRVYGKIFADELLKVGNRSTEEVDGISNRELDDLFGTDRAARRVALALRLFHFGSHAAFLSQGGYDMHSAEQTNLPMELDRLNRVLSGLHVALHKMQHPEGGTYWDKTLVVLGSEFGRTTGGSRFNSAGGSDHGSDYATRWMSMPMMGGLVEAAGKGGKQLGLTRQVDLSAVGKVYSYRSMMKTMMDLLGADHSTAFPADRPIEDLFA
ncbi:MAG: DUF1501 domain-containing protein [Myxococcaceae bacterium]